MKIKELEGLLSISRSNIRFYEKQGLFIPERQKNNYREYTEQDVALLKKIVLLRKMGFTVEEIKSIQANELPFSQAIAHTKQRLEDEIEQLNGSLKLLGQVSKECDSFEQIDVQKHWDDLKASEQSGEAFLDLCKDILKLELSSFDSMWKYVFFHDFKKSREKHGIIKACLILLVICILRGISKVVIYKESFWSGFFYPFTIILIASLMILPIFLLGIRFPKVAAVLIMILMGLICLFIAALVILLFCGILGLFA